MKFRNFDVPKEPVKNKRTGSTKHHVIFTPPKRNFANLPKKDNASTTNTQDIRASESIALALSMSWRLF